MKYLLKLSLFVLLVSLSFSCKKKSTDPGPLPIPTPASKDNFPLTIGSSWQYKYANNEDHYYYVTDRAISSGGKTFKEIKGILNGRHTSYYHLCKSDGNYYQADSFSTYDAPPFQQPYGKGLYEHILFKDNAKPGDSWRDSIKDHTNEPGYVVFKTDVIDVGLTVTIGETTYENVAIFNSIRSHTDLPTLSLYYNYNYYVAKGIGIIKRDNMELIKAVIK